MPPPDDRSPDTVLPDTAPPDDHQRFALRRGVAVASGVVFSALAFLGSQVSMLLPGWHWNSFREYFLSDQLANFAVVANAAHGDFRAVEPFTETGHLSDPHLYLEAIGAVARLTGLPPATTWTLGGLALQVVLVGCISVSAARLSGRWWASFFGVLPFLIGTLSFGPDAWATLLTSHAVLWGTFASTFSLNEVPAALAIGASLLLLLLAAGNRDRWTNKTMGLAVLTGAGVGLLADIDTYAFFTVTFFVCFGLATYAMATEARRWPWVLSLVLVVVLYLTGTHLTAKVGRLDAFALGLVPALPGLLLATRRWRGRVLLPAAAALLAAAPQIVTVSTALAGGDAFLKYREAASAGLGVPWKPGLWCAIPLLVPLLMVFLAGLHRRRPLWIACSLGTAAAWFLVATNDAWGPNQEPYQFWTDAFALAAFLTVPVAIGVATSYLAPRANREVGLGFGPRLSIASLALASLVVVGVSSVDWWNFYRSQKGQTVSFATARDNAMKAVVPRVTNDELLMADPCVNGPILKAVTGARVAWYNLGLAWPDRLAQIILVGDNLTVRTVSAGQLASARIGWLVTDGSCSADWGPQLAPILTRSASSSYGPKASNVITLWQFKPTGPVILLKHPY